MNGVIATSTKDSGIKNSTSIKAVVFVEIFIVPDTGDIYFFKESNFDETIYDDFYTLIDKQQELAKANEKLKEVAIKVDDTQRKEKKTASDEFKKKAKLDMDEEFKSVETPKRTISEEYNSAVDKAEEAFKACDEAIKKTTGKDFNELIESDENNDFVEVVSLTRERPILLPKEKFDSLSGKATITEKISSWEVTKGTKDNDFMGLVRSLKDSEGNFHGKTINSAFKKVTGSVKLAEWPKEAKKEGNASFGSTKLAEILKDINDNAEVSTDKDKKLSDEIKKVLDDKLRKTEFTVDNAEFVLRSIRDLYGKKNEKSPETDFTNFVKSKLGEPDDSYNKTSAKPYTIYTLTDDDTGDEKRDALLSEMDKTGLPPKMWDASASAKILRYSATAGGSATTNLKDGVVDYKLKAEAKFDLVDAKAETNCYLPSDKGFHFCFDAKVRKNKANYKVDIVDNDNAAFFHNSSFISANTARGLLLNLAEAQRIIINQNTNATLAGVDEKDKGYVVLNAHTDKSGSEGYNQRLSMYRALAAFAFIYKDVDAWFSFFKKGVWKQKEADYMISILAANENPFGKTKQEFDTKLKVGDLHPFQFSNLFSNDIFFGNEKSIFGGLELKIYPYDKYQEYFCKSPIGKMENFGSDISLYDPNDQLWEDKMKNRIRQYFEVVHQTIEVKEKINSIKTDKLLITRANVHGFGESKASPTTSNKNFKERNIQVVCYSFDTAEQAVVDGTLDFGHIRIKFNGYASAWAGVQASVTAGLEVKSDKLMLLQGLQPEKLSDEENEEVGKGSPSNSIKTEKGKDVEEGASLGAAGEAFAGVKAETGIKALLEWLKPAAADFSHLAEMGYSISGMAGAGASFDFKVGYDARSGKFVCKMKAEATLGLGCGGAFSFAVSMNSLVDFIKLVYEKLKDVDFSYLDIFEGEGEGGRVDVYQLFSQTVIELLKSGKVIGALSVATGGAIAIEMAPLLKIGNRLVLKWQNSTQEEENLKELAETINANSDILEYLTPETKGRILYLLSKYSISSWWEDIQEFDWNQKNEKLALKLIEKSIVTKKDYVETLAHMAKFDGNEHLSKNRKNFRPYISDPKSIEDEKDNKKISNKNNRMKKNQEWLCNVLFTDVEDKEAFDKLVKDFQ